MNNLTFKEDLIAAVRKQKALQCVALWALTLFVPVYAQAAGWNIDPVRIELSPQQQTAALTVTNDSDQPTSIQIQAVAWTQVEGKDVYTPTKEVLVSPPFVTIAPKGVQIIRVALRRHADEKNELAYRINLQEMPPSAKPDFIGVQVALRIGLPVFVQPQMGEAVPRILWNVAQMSGDKLKVGVRNQGNAHIQISDFVLFVSGTDKPISGQAGSSYILAGQSHEWLLNQNSAEKIADGHLRLKAYTDAEDIDTELLLNKP